MIWNLLCEAVMVQCNITLKLAKMGITIARSWIIYSEQCDLAMSFVHRLSRGSPMLRRLSWKDFAVSNVNEKIVDEGSIHHTP